MRCHDTHYHHGICLQCEGDVGHASAHWNGGVWWSNPDGLPDHLPRVEYKFRIAMAAVGAILLLALAWYLFR